MTNKLIRLMLIATYSFATGQEIHNRPIDCNKRRIVIIKSDWYTIKTVDWRNYYYIKFKPLIAYDNYYTAESFLKNKPTPKNKLNLKPGC